MRHLNRLGFSVQDVSDQQTAMTAFSEMIVTQSVLDAIAAKPSDNRVLECAVDGRASHIVTGDRKHLLPLREYAGIGIVSPREFVTMMEQG